MSKTLIEFIITLDEESLIEVWNSFNSWQWPECIPGDFKPHWWDKFGSIERKHGYFYEINRYIQSKVEKRKIIPHAIEPEW